MEQMTGSNNWKLTLRRDGSGVTILRALTCDARAELPERLPWGEVTALGDHALAPGAPPAEGETLELRGAPSEAPWDNRALGELTLPPSLRVVGDYALMNCRALGTLRLTDRPIAWGTGALMNCLSLSRVVLDRRGGDPGQALAYFTGELSRELDISLWEGERCAARLIFPEYFEEYVENSPAHHFDYRVSGPGQPYHQVFRGGGLNWYGYDGLWPKLLAGEHEVGTAVRLAWWRLCRPEGLSGDAAEGYRSYLAAHAGEALDWLLTLRDTALLRRFLDEVDPDADALRRASAAARENRDAAASALLLEALRRRGGAAKRFEL